MRGKLPGAEYASNGLQLPLETALVMVILVTQQPLQETWTGQKKALKILFFTWQMNFLLDLIVPSK